MTKKIISALLCVLLIVSSAVLVSAADSSKASTGTNTKYTTACEAIDAQYAYDGELGSFYTPERTTFKVWAPKANSVNVNLYSTGSNNEEGAEKLDTQKLLKLEEDGKWTGVWKGVIDGDLKNLYYTYTINTFDVLGLNLQTTETEDVYSQATGVNGNRSMIVDLDDTDPEGWSSDTHVMPENVTDSYVWEVHVKDFSYAKNSGVSDANRGKFLAFTETGTTLNGEGKVSTCIDYLKQLGVTTVQINPFYDFGSIDEGGSDTQFNWGYDPMNYNVPEGSYSSNPYDGNVRIKECKQMIQALHNAGISVIMDVVYNHTYVTDTCFTRTLPNYFYRMKNDKGAYSDASGCGNDTASERAMFRKYMIESCRYWVDEYHVDGFRFDLMGLHDTETMNMIRDNLDEVSPRIAMWGEGWYMGSNFPSKTCSDSNLLPANQNNAGTLNKRIGFFSDDIRDALKGSVFQKTAKGWLQGSGASVKKVSENIRANPSNISNAVPSQVVQYASCHDNQTLWDRLADSQGYKDFRAREEELVSETKLCAAFLHTSQGITFTLAGEELGRSKDNDENSYSSSATENMIDWSLAQSNADISSYYAGLRKIRENFSPFRANDRSARCDIDFINPTYSDAGSTNISGSDGYTALWTNNINSEWSKLVVLTNNKNKNITCTLRDTNKNWVIIADDQQAGVRKIGEVNDNTFTLAPRSAIIAVDKASFESVSVTNDRSAVKVLAKDKTTGKTIDSYTITGKVGTGYSIAEPNVGEEYTIESVDGDMDGVFTAEDKQVTINYDYFIPASVENIDLNGDGKSNINDATDLQLDIVTKKPLAEQFKAKADVTLDGKTNINDVTMIQRYLANLSVGIGNVTVNYYKTGTEETIIPSVVKKARVGTTYTSVASSLLGYNLNTGEMPVETVTVPYGDVEINYYYDSVSVEVNLHVKHSSGSGYNPTFWIWGQKDGVDTGNYCKNTNWPGDTVTTADGDGWYNKSFTVDANDTAYNFIISNNGSPKSIDCKGFIDNELWIVIDDSKDGANLIVYAVNPDTNPGATPIFTT